MLFLLLGGGTVVAFIALAALGLGDVLPFALAFAAFVASEAFKNAAIARRETAVSWKTALYSIMGVGVCAALMLAAFRLLRQPLEVSGMASVGLGIVAGNFLSDTLLKAWPGSARSETR